VTAISQAFPVPESTDPSSCPPGPNRRSQGLKNPMEVNMPTRTTRLSPLLAVSVNVFVVLETSVSAYKAPFVSVCASSAGPQINMPTSAALRPRKLGHLAGWFLCFCAAFEEERTNLEKRIILKLWLNPENEPWWAVMATIPRGVRQTHAVEQASYSIPAPVLSRFSSVECVFSLPNNPTNLNSIQTLYRGLLRVSRNRWPDYRTAAFTPLRLQKLRRVGFQIANCKLQILWICSLQFAIRDDSGVNQKHCTAWPRSVSDAKRRERSVNAPVPAHGCVDVEMGRDSRAVEMRYTSLDPPLALMVNIS